LTERTIISSCSEACKKYEIQNISKTMEKAYPFMEQTCLGGISNIKLGKIRVN
jgi:hypothetical protein